MNSFNEESTTIWSFKDRGDWATHKGDYPGNCSPYVVKNLLIKYTNKNDIVLDQFVGSGTTIIESLLLNRKTIGIDINDKALNITKSRIKDIGGKYKLIRGDATKLKLKNKSIDFICTHPPYMDIIKYSNGIRGDISLLSGEEFYNSIKLVAKESFRVLKEKCYCAILIGDVRKNGLIVPVGFNVMELFLNEGFLLKEIIIKEQHNCKSTDKWIEIAKKRNFLLIQHEYIFVFQKGYFK
ncbi:MAG: DNA methyltransferase [Clostridium sp.]